MFVIFYKTNNVFLAEEILNINKVFCEIVPTPVQDKAYCGICLNVLKVDKSRVMNLLKGIEFKIIEE